MSVLKLKYTTILTCFLLLFTLVISILSINNLIRCGSSFLISTFFVKALLNSFIFSFIFLISISLLSILFISSSYLNICSLNPSFLFLNSTSLINPFKLKSNSLSFCFFIKSISFSKSFELLLFEILSTIFLYSVIT